MTNRENQHRLDRLAMTYLAAIERGDFDAIDALWDQAADDFDLSEMLHGLNVELTNEQDESETVRIDRAVLEMLEKHLPSSEVVRSTSTGVSVREVADHLRRNPPAGLTADDVLLNDRLRTVLEEVPADLGISKVVDWGERFGVASDAYWRAFRHSALKLRMQRESEANYQMAARPTKPKPPERKV